MMEDTRGRDINATFSGGETFKQTTKNSVHFKKSTLSEDCDYFNRTGLYNIVDRHLENDLSHSINSFDRHLENDLSHSINEEEVERVNEEEVSFLKDYLKNNPGE